MGRSRGGLTTKVHALVDANGLPLELVLTPSQTEIARSAPAPGSAWRVCGGFVR
jgi:transposase